MYRDINEARSEFTTQILYILNIMKKPLREDPSLKNNIQLIFSYFLDFYQRLFVSINHELEEKFESLRNKMALLKTGFKQKIFLLEKNNFLQKELSLYSKKLSHNEVSKSQVAQLE